VLALLHSAEFIDVPPAQVYATLLGRGEYVCSISTMYRVLRDADEVRERRRQARHAARARPELTADGPGQVYTWDITKLAGPVRGRWFDAYVMIDIYSRYIVGVQVHAHESAPLAAEMMREVFGVHGIPQVVHADRGTSMTSKTVAQLLEDLGVVRSHSRPRVSNDNPLLRGVVQDTEVRPPPSRTGSPASRTPAAIRNSSRPGITSGITTPASACTSRPTFTPVAPTPSTPPAPRRSTRPDRPTPNASAASPTYRRSLICPTAPGSTTPGRRTPNTKPSNTHWPQTP